MTSRISGGTPCIRTPADSRIPGHDDRRGPMGIEDERALRTIYDRYGGVTLHFATRLLGDGPHA